jgi:hypothetical protein
MSELRKEEILKILKHKVSNYELIFKKDLEKFKEISLEEIEKYWKWMELREILGLVRCRSRKKYIPKHKRYNNKELLKLYKSLSIKLGKGDCGASIIDMKQNNFPMTGTGIAKRFGGIENLRKMAGINKTKKVVYKESEEIKELLCKKYIEYGRKLKWSELRKVEEIPSVYVVYKRFKVKTADDLWNKILNEAE